MFTQSGTAGVAASVMVVVPIDRIMNTQQATVGGTVMGGAGATRSHSAELSTLTLLWPLHRIMNLSDSTEIEMDVVTFTMSGASDSGANISFEAWA